MECPQLRPTGSSDLGGFAGRVCRTAGQRRSTQRKVARGHEDEERPTADILGLTRESGRYGYGHAAAPLHRADWVANDKRVERIWRREWSEVPAR